jgi:hypothetical protein
VSNLDGVIKPPKSTGPRPRRYVSRWTLLVLAPLLRYSEGREAYVLRAVGHWRGPVLRLDRRRGRPGYSGPNRRRGRAGGVVLG